MIPKILHVSWSKYLRNPVLVRVLIAGLLGCLISFELFSLVRSLDQQERESDLGTRADNLITSLRRSIDGELDEVRSLRAFNASGREMTREEFGRFVDDSVARHPELQGFSWNPLVTADQRNSFEQAARSQGYSSFQVTERDASGRLGPAPARSEYVVVYFIEPYQANSSAIGYNVASDPVRLQALERARDSGQMTATAPIALVQDNTQTTAVLVFYPIFRQSVPISSVQQRRDNLLGYVAGILRVKDMVDLTLGTADRRGIAVSLSDSTIPQQSQSLYSDTDAIAGAVPFESARFDVAGRAWTIHLYMLPSAIAQNSSVSPLAWIALFAGLLFTTVVAGFIFASARHASELETAYKALRESEHRFRSVAQTAGDAIVSLDGHGRIIFWNRAAEAIFGYTSEEAVGQLLDIIIPERYREEHLHGVLEASHGYEPDRLGKTIEMTARHKNGIEFSVERSLSMWVNGSEVFFTGILRDITERKNVERKLRFLSSHDVLTGLYNRGFFEEELTRLRGGREYPIGIVMIDLDELKRVNDTQGHSAGDKLIRHAAVLLAESFRAEDIVARIGGDEFAVLLPGADEPTLQEIIQRVREQVQTRNHAYPSFPLEFSLGAVVVHSEVELSEGLRIADERMYAAKQRDRGRGSAFIGK